MLGDTIAAIASPVGAAERGVIRISGACALAAAARLVRPAPGSTRAGRAGTLAVRGSEVDVLCLVMPGPGSYTGEDVVELHLPGSPLLLECTLAALEAEGVRRGTPGEFTRRAFEHGRLSLEQAEAVAGLIAARGESARRLAVYALSGGLGAAVAVVRSALEDARAALESGLDFTAEETGAVDPAAWAPALATAEVALSDLHAQLPEPVPEGEVLLLGAAAAGKSSLANALLGREALLVGAGQGTTRDVIAVRLGPHAALLDAPGDIDEPGETEAAALALRDRFAGRVAAALVVVDLSDPRAPRLPGSLPVLGVVATKCDLVADRAAALAAVRAALAPVLAAAAPAHPPRWFVVSNVDGEGIEALRTHLLGATPGCQAPEAATRWRAALAQALAAVRCARAAAAESCHEELVAADLAHALAALDELHGRTSPEALLDRIFTRFCLGK